MEAFICVTFGTGRHSNAFRKLQPGLFPIATAPAIGIGRQASISARPLSLRGL